MSPKTAECVAIKTVIWVYTVCVWSGLSIPILKVNTRRLLFTDNKENNDINTATNWVKTSVGDILKHFSHFSQKIRFDLSCHYIASLIVSEETMTNPIFWKKESENVIC